MRRIEVDEVINFNLFRGSVGLLVAVDLRVVELNHAAHVLLNGTRREIIHPCITVCCQTERVELEDTRGVRLALGRLIANGLVGVVLLVAMINPVGSLVGNDDLPLGIRDRTLLRDNVELIPTGQVVTDIAVVQHGLARVRGVFHQYADGHRGA